LIDNLITLEEYIGIDVREGQSLRQIAISREKRKETDSN